MSLLTVPIVNNNNNNNNNNNILAGIYFVFLKERPRTNSQVF